jgi:hypothetical protein
LDTVEWRLMPLTDMAPYAVGSFVTFMCFLIFVQMTCSFVKFLRILSAIE